MQSRSDEALMRMPGYRDRIVHVHLTAKEGEMNLDMDPTRIGALTKRGRGAGQRLVETYTRPASEGAINWDAHRWTRLRLALVTLEQLHTMLRSGYTAPVEPSQARSYSELLHRGREDPPTNYRIRDRSLVELGTEQLDGTCKLAKDLTDAGKSFAEGAPRPRGVVRVTPADD